jgi:hypothetical protein
MLKSVRRNVKSAITASPADISTENLKRAWNDVCQVMKENNCQSRLPSKAYHS